jgi:hypothetical protein
MVPAVTILLQQLPVSTPDLYATMSMDEETTTKKCAVRHVACQACRLAHTACDGYALATAPAS